MNIWIKKTAWFFIIVLCIYIFIRISQNKHISTQTVTSSAFLLTPSTSLLPSPFVEYQQKRYSYEYVHVPNQKIGVLELIPNFSEKRSFAELMTLHACQAGINGSYYDTDNRPLGGFTNNGKVLKQPISSRLMDGYISMTNKNFNIGLTPLPDSHTVLQTGPLLMLNEKPTSLRITADEPARRSIAVKTKSGSLYFFSIYDPDSVYLGPYLADLPHIVDVIGKEMALSIVSAVNLDGGNASAFKNDAITLTELTRVGSVFCLK